ncbi:TPA: hypothetical protein N0F65_007223 [Lagenidium giganteum]|uniref:PHD-type domain-containing protein n=1 Tax=Lagenidium giganteum TaxID=4803 RepID=A0AAV2ZA78_9STRA|nr:TPA: hypothetical protein N0F65_007223 [Lagenidium giganteum]
MMAVEGEFDLSKWFNRVSSKAERAELQHADSAVQDRLGSAAADSSAASASECYMCRMPNPDYWSTNAVKNMPSVPVCSIECEADYLEKKGMRAASGKRVTHCHVCRKANPKNWSTTPSKDVPSVPVCDSHCEALYLKRNGVKRATKPTSSKRTKRESTDDSDFEELGDAFSMHKKLKVDTANAGTLLESEDGKGYKSWWVGALAFYSFVYQRHGMWHCYSMGDNEPRVEACLTKFWTCNIYRELDRSTAYLRKHVLRWRIAHQDRLSLREVLWMAVVFRYCNKLETFDKLKGIPSSDSFRQFKKKMLALGKRNDESHAMFAGNRELDAEKYLEVMEEFLEQLDLCTFQVKQSTSTRQVFEELRKFSNNALGSFTCWQVTADLMELNILGEEVERDDFVWLSLDAQKSLAQIFGKRRTRPSEFVALAKLLQQRQAQGFNAIQVRFPYFMNQKLNLKNIGHALHVFQMYRNIKLVEAKQSNKIEPDTTLPSVYSSRSYLLDSECCEVCNKGDNADEQVLCDLCNRLFHKYCIDMDELPPASWVCTPCVKLLSLPEEGLVVVPEPENVE